MYNFADFIRDKHFKGADFIRSEVIENLTHFWLLENILKYNAA